MAQAAATTDQDLRARLARVREEASKVILDKTRELELALCCLIAGGHLLVEDIPGVGKTTLVKTLARLFGLESSRVQFTNDLLPGDILGSSIYDPERKGFIFTAGRSLLNSSSRMNSTARHQKRRAPVCKRWKNVGSRSTA